MIARMTLPTRPTSDTRVANDPELRAALVRFMDRMDEARASGGSQALGDLVVPAIFGEAAGGGRRFATLTPAHLCGLSRLYQELTTVNAAERAEADTPKILH